jgi:hypothetical protein
MIADMNELKELVHALVENNNQEADTTTDETANATDGILTAHISFDTRLTYGFIVVDEEAIAEPSDSAPPAKKAKLTRKDKGIDGMLHLLPRLSITTLTFDFNESQIS